jgi:hypothetical protein
MKKLLVLMLVLGLASTANAYIELRIGGSPAPGTLDVVAGDTAAIQVYDDNTTQNGYVGYIIVESGGDGVLNNAVVEASAGSSGDASAYSYYGWGAGYTLTAMSITGDIAAGHHFTITYDAAGLSEGDSAVISLWDGRTTPTAYSEVGSMNINIVPEPITIALLGLGGLFLRRRK